MYYKTFHELYAHLKGKVVEITPKEYEEPKEEPKEEVKEEPEKPKKRSSKKKKEE